MSKKFRRIKRKREEKLLRKEMKSFEDAGIESIVEFEESIKDGEKQPTIFNRVRRFFGMHKTIVLEK